ESTGGKAEFLSSDLHDAESARLLAAEAVTRLGHIDVLVNNAGRALIRAQVTSNLGDPAYPFLRRSGPHPHGTPSRTSSVSLASR
ncbi:SDR family NAD(P)-dependent oxidoreductase, partial [Mycolicibacterium goodii]|nr:SDR family NAD(P)-dependent oxidoreductase [Mycolicibacterium goodii]